ncbi:MAG: flavin-containing monooxygenase [Candidatus Tectimicrobiota bacterium]
MTTATALPTPAEAVPGTTYEALIIGAGVSGLYQLYKLRELGISTRVLEAGSNVGGTWYWNRYPGARFDSESWTYGYSFSKALLEEWTWEEHFAAQPETERYLNYVADRFDLRRDIQCNSRVSAAHYDEAKRRWHVTLADGQCYHSRFLITAIGVLSAPTMPRIPGMETFQGRAWHTAEWPKEPVTFAGKRVAVIGTGATGVQTIQEVAKTVGHLTVFQRTPNWCAPLHNSKISADEMQHIRAHYAEIFARCHETPGCFIHAPDPRSALEVTPEEREAFWEKLYAAPGFGIWQGNFRDIVTDRQANALVSDFIARKIRQRVQDPAVADKLIPTNHGFGTRRVPLESGYYEVYNQPNVKLVDLHATPIERITPTGITTSDADYAFDIIIYATGFDAITGAFDRIDIRGVAGRQLKEEWREGPRTWLGVMAAGFPNLLMVMGPHAALGNFPRAAEYSVNWVTGLLQHAHARGLSRLEPSEAGVAEWTEHVRALGQGTLVNEVNSWMTGVNSNVEGKQVRRVMRYAGTYPSFREHCDAIAADGYRGLHLT